MACRLCLLVFGEGNGTNPVLDKSWKTLIPNILPQVMVDLSADPTICEECSFKLEEYENLRNTCRIAEERVTLYRQLGRPIDDSQIDLRDVLIYYGEDVESMGEYICRLCFESCVGEFFSLSGNNIYEVFVKSLFLEGIIENIHNPILCKTCADKIEGMYLFQQMCLDVENMLQDYAANETLSEEVIVAFAKDIGHMITDDNSDSQPGNPENSIASTQAVDVSPIGTKETSKSSDAQDENCNNVLTDNASVNNIEIVIGEPISMINCPHCNFQTKKKSYLKEHIYVKHTTHKKMFKCPACDFKTVLKRYLRNHIKTQHVQVTSVHRCPHCDFMTRQRYALTRHMKTKHKVAADSVSAPTEVPVEITEDTDDSAFEECGFCSYKTKRVDTLKVHIALEHAGNQEGSHFLQDALDSTYFDCTDDDQTQTEPESTELAPTELLQTENDVKEGETTQQPSEESLEDTVFKNGPPFQCTMCGYSTRRKHDMKRHIYNIHSKVWEIVSCSYCDYQTKSKDNLTKHIKCKHMPYDM